MFSSVACGAEESGVWKQNQLNETYMRSISKDLCMKKTIATLKHVCTSDGCIKTLGGVTGDCTTWASGDVDAYCRGYDANYIEPYCTSQYLDQRQCLLLYTHRTVFCGEKQR